jgi:hypothetical protein
VSCVALRKSRLLQVQFLALAGEGLVGLLWGLDEMVHEGGLAERPMPRRRIVIIRQVVGIGGSHL